MKALVLTAPAGREHAKQLGLLNALIFNQISHQYKTKLGNETLDEACGPGN